jgi:uncharacterized repeat protein (TIGR01451 family)/CSLREA domain-containing protein
MTYRDFTKRQVSLITTLVVVLVAATMVLVMPAQADSTITVTTTSDVVASDGLCSLREAIVAANTDSAFHGCPAGSGADTVVFSPGLPQPATFVLTTSGANEDAASTGDLDVVGTLTINGAGLENTILDGNGSDRVFDIQPGAHVTISGVTIRNGDAGAGLGGGIKVLGALTLSNSSVESNLGGGIGNVGGSLTLSNVKVTNNTGDYGIRNQNQAAFSFAGGLVSGNQGGGIYNATSSATLSALSIVNNIGGGGVYNTGASLTHLTISQGTVMTNTATSGGGIFNEGVGAIIDIHDTRISGNQAGAAGGGVFNNGIMTINSSLIDHNQARSGGAIEHFGGTLHLTNDTLSGNTAGDNGGGLYNLGNATLTNVTLSSNTASGPDTGGNIFNDEAQLAIGNTIVAYSEVDGNCFNSAGFIHSLGHNLDSANTCGFSAVGDRVNTDPLLGPLQDNGGDTPTHALLTGSPAIDQGDNASCPATDQRGIPRPQGIACDIGAYEAGATADLGLAVDVSPALIGLGDRMTYTLVISNLGPSAAMSVMLTDTLPSDVTFITANLGGGGICADGSAVTCTLSSLDADTSVTATIVVTAPPSPEVITNTAWVASTTPDLSPENNTMTTVVRVSQIRQVYLPLILRQ